MEKVFSKNIKWINLNDPKEAFGLYIRYKANGIPFYVPKIAMFFFITLNFDAQNSEKCAKLCIYLVKYLRKTINIHSFAPQI